MSKTYVLLGNKNKTRPFLHINLLIKNFVQQQNHFNGNVFGNKCYCCNEGSLYDKINDREAATKRIAQTIRRSAKCPGNAHRCCYI